MIVWLIGLAGAGKTTIGRMVHDILKRRNPATVFLDGDKFRAVMGNDLGHSIADRRKNGERLFALCRLLDEQGIDAVCCVLSLFPEHRERCRKTFGRYVEVFVDVPFDELVRRDQKGLYSGALAGRIENVVGVDIPFERPADADLVVDNGRPTQDLRPLATRIVDFIDEGRRT